MAEIYGPPDPNGPVMMPGSTVAPGTPGGVDPATIQAMLALNAQDPKKQAVARQLALANQLRADAGGQLSGKRVGIANVGASILNNLAAKRMGDQSDVTLGNLGAERQGALEKYFNDLTGRKRAALPNMGDPGE